MWDPPQEPQSTGFQAPRDHQLLDESTSPNERDSNVSKAVLGMGGGIWTTQVGESLVW